MPRNDREVWEFLGANDEVPSELTFITYAIYAYEKYDWISEFERRASRPPGADEIDQWIADITTYRFDGMRSKAAELFDEGARRLLAPEIERQKQAAVDGSILAEVKATSSFWKQIVLSLIASVLAPLIIGGMIVAARSYDIFMPTASGIADHATPAKPSSAPAGTAGPAPAVQKQP